MGRQAAAFTCAPTADAILAPSPGRSGRGRGRAACAGRCRGSPGRVPVYPPCRIPNRPRPPTSCPACGSRRRARPAGPGPVRPGPVVRLGVTGGVHQAGDVPGVAEHEGAVPTEQLGSAVAVLPCGQMVGDRTGDEGGHLDSDRARSGCRAPCKRFGLTSRLWAKMSRNCPCSAPGRFVPSAFQARMSNAGGLRPIR